MRTWHRLFSALSGSLLVVLGTAYAADQPATGATA